MTPDSRGFFPSPSSYTSPPSSVRRRTFTSTGTLSPSTKRPRRRTGEFLDGLNNLDFSVGVFDVSKTDVVLNVSLLSEKFEFQLVGLYCFFTGNAEFSGGAGVKYHVERGSFTCTNFWGAYVFLVGSGGSSWRAHCLQDFPRHARKLR